MKAFVYSFVEKTWSRALKRRSDEFAIDVREMKRRLTALSSSSVRRCTHARFLAQKTHPPRTLPYAYA